MVLPINRSNRCQILECGGNPAKRERHRLGRNWSNQIRHTIQKRRRRYALPAQSKTLPRQRMLFAPIILESDVPV
jgi:hypothetical protein